MLSGVDGTFPTHQSLGTDDTQGSFYMDFHSLFSGMSAPREEGLHLFWELLYLQGLKWSLAQGPR